MGDPKNLDDLFDELHEQFQKRASKQAPASVPAAVDAPRASVSGDRLRMPWDAKLPSVCLKCGTRTGVDLEDYPFAHVPLRYVLLLIVSHIHVHWAGTLRIPLCGPCAHRYDEGRRIWRLGPALSVVAGLSMLGLIDYAPAWRFILLWAPCFAAPWIAAYLFARPRLLWISAIDRNSVTVSGAHAQARAVIAGSKP